MAKTKPKDKQKPAAEAVAQEPQAAQLPTVFKQRLSYPKSLEAYAGIDARGWQVLTDVVFPNATTIESIVLAVQYCHARKLDIFKKVVHIVPMRRDTGKKDNQGRKIYEWVDTIWPGIAEVRITATRTGVYAGKDAAIFGPMITETFRHIDDRNDAVVKEETITFPEWVRVDVYKIVQGIRCKFEGPVVYWKEAYATESFFSDIPNTMWKDRRSGQLEKCGEAASLRSAFPEELGGEYTAEEMHGRVLEGHAAQTAAATPSATMTPERPKESDFDRTKAAPDATTGKLANDPKTGQPKAKPQKKPVTGKPDRENATDVVGDGHPVPPAGGEPVPVDLAREREEEVQASEAMTSAREMLAEYGAAVNEVPDLDQFKNFGRVNIDNFVGLNDAEKKVLHAEFNSVVLAETKRRERKKR